MTIREARRLLDTREVSAPELTRDYLRRIREQDSRLGSFFTVCEQEALRCAHAAQRMLDREEGGPLTGIPVGVKDNFSTEGVLTTCGSRMLADYMPDFDADMVLRLKEAGCVLLGKTAMDEFAMGNATQTAFQGPTRNPLDVARVPGGSSGGSAAAVAADLCLMGLGSDTGGSVTQPAAFCGITGLKPTWGTLSRYGLVAFASGLDQPGILAETPEDCASTMRVLASGQTRDACLSPARELDYSLLSKAEVLPCTAGLPMELLRLPSDDGVMRLFETALWALERLGVHLADISLPELPESVSLYQILTTAQAASNLGRYDGVRYGARAENGPSFAREAAACRGASFGPEVKRRILMGNLALRSEREGNLYRRACQAAENLRRQYAEAFTRCDVILSPTALLFPFRPDEFKEHPARAYQADVCTTGCNVAGLPSLSVPCGMDGGLPAGLLFTGPRFSERRLLSLGDIFYREVWPC